MSAPTSAPRILPRPPITTTAKASTTSSTGESRGAGAAGSQSAPPTAPSIAPNLTTHAEADEDAGDDEHGQEKRRSHPMRDAPADRGDAEISPEGVERPAREVHDLLYAEHELQTGGDQEENGGVEDAADQYVEECGHSLM